MEFEELITKLESDYPDINFEPGTTFSWNLKNKKISYLLPDNDKQANTYSNKLLHELAHAILEHSDYKSDTELLKIESSAWRLAQELATKYKVKFDPKEQEESLASYIQWASSRSQCPECKKNGLQMSQTEFLCPNCSHKWKVGKSRFTRTYRQPN
jgi:predicted RNA-binding Zn-ribbon protein involved in translation (DUF1610 family)